MEYLERWPPGPSAPIGYRNKSTEDGRKYIAVHEQEADLIRWIFSKLNTRTYFVEQIYKGAKELGLRCCKAHFWRLIKKPVYCGKIYLNAYKDEESRHVPGQHEPIISEALFYSVQDYLEGRKTYYSTQLGTKEIFQLRGILLCPRCGKLLTSSASRGCSGKKYAYYHCHSSCGFRVSAEDTIDRFKRELFKWTPKSGMAESFVYIINKEYRDFFPS